MKKGTVSQALFIRLMDKVSLIVVSLVGFIVVMSMGEGSSLVSKEFNLAFPAWFNLILLIIASLLFFYSLASYIASKISGKGKEEKNIPALIGNRAVVFTGLLIASVLIFIVLLIILIVGTDAVGPFFYSFIPYLSVFFISALGYYTLLAAGKEKK